MKVNSIGSSITINGGKKLEGLILPQGDKTVAVHLLFTLIFCPQTQFQFSRFPNCADVITVLNWIKTNISCRMEYSNSTLLFESLGLPSLLDIRAINSIRSSICLLVPLVLINKKVIFQKVGGCNFTHRPIGRHLELAKEFGIIVTEYEDHYVATLSETKESVNFDCSVIGIPSVGVTSHALISALVFEKNITLSQVSIEPSILAILDIVKHRLSITYDLPNRKIRISQKNCKPNSSYKGIIDFDQTATLTYIAAALSSKGKIEFSGNIYFPPSTVALLKKMNIIMSLKEGISKFQSNHLKNPNEVICQPSPGIPTDSGPILSALLCSVEGSCSIYDAVYNNRQSHITPLQDMGFDINFCQNKTITIGKQAHENTSTVVARDIRAGAAILIGALSRPGQTTVKNFEQVFRGYENILENLENIGADIKF